MLCWDDKVRVVKALLLRNVKPCFDKDVLLSQVNRYDRKLLSPKKPFIHMEYQVNFETSWIAGIWSADRGSTAKGVVALNNSNDALRETFKRLSIRNFDIGTERLRERQIRGYGVTYEVYYTRLPARRFIETLVDGRSKLPERMKLAFMAGKFDGDGTVDYKRSLLCYYYGVNESGEMEIDKRLIESLGFKTSSGTCGKKALRLRVLNPRFFAEQIVNHVKHPKKKIGLKRLMKKRSYRA
jgi:hypothetical protein